MKIFLLLPIFLLAFVACMPERTAPDIFPYRPTRYAPEIERSQTDDFYGYIDYYGDWPTRPITVVVPFIAGGDTDIYARMLAPFLTEILGQPINVVNIDGLAGTVGMTSVYESEPDGYTVLFYHTGGLFSNIFVGTTSLNYNNLVVSNAVMHCDANVFVINANLGLSTGQEFIEYARANPFRMRTALTLSGFTFMLSRMAELAGDFQTTPIDVGGAVLMLPAVRAGHADVTNVTVTMLMSYIDDEEIVPLWIAASERNPSIPHVPTMAEVGIEGGYIGRTFFYAFPFGVDEYIAIQFSNAVAEVIQNPDFLYQLYGTSSLTPFFLPFHEVTEYLATQWQALDGFEEYMRH